MALLAACQPAPLGSAEAVQASQPGAVQARISGRTLRFFGTRHGTQIQYYAPSGQAYLWYPGNSAVVTGTWAVRADPRLSSTVCFVYPGSRIEGPQCHAADFFFDDAVEYVSGDPFGLSSGRVPGVLPPRRDMSLVEVSTAFGPRRIVGTPVDWAIANGPGQREVEEIMFDIERIRHQGN